MSYCTNCGGEIGKTSNFCTKCGYDLIVEELRINESEVAQTEPSIPDIKCPRCRSATVLRRAKTGSNTGKEFYVCTRYPECKGTIPVPTKKQMDASVLLGGFVGDQCPLCHLREVETIATARRVRGFLIVVQISSYPLAGCVPCVRRALYTEVFLSLLLGWFSPRALIFNPFFIIYNIVRALTLRPTLKM